MKSAFPKKTFTYLFILLTVSLLILPFITTFDHFLTKVVNTIGGYQIIQNYIVPHEAKIVAVLLKPFGFRVASGAGGGGPWGTLGAVLLHDYFAATILTFIWLFFFWWFSYTFVLEE